jgi:hypothetical protein
MRALEMGIIGVFKIGRLLKRGRVHGVAHQLVECAFDVLMDGTLVLEGLNGGIELVNVLIEGLDVLLVLDVVNNQCIEFLVVGFYHLGRGKNG